MRAPAFWSRPGHPLGRLLAPLGAVYGRASAARMDGTAAADPGCPVLCAGNFTLGGAGKTPTAIALAGILRAAGYRPAFLSRGYGGRLPGPVPVDPGQHGAGDVGDEPLLLARHAPAVVARDRPAGARLCRALGADVIVMDDGLQNPSLPKTLALAVVDGGAGLGNARVFPAGPLRAPLARQWPHVHGLVLIGAGEAGEAVAHQADLRGLPVHRARLVPEADDLAGRPVLAFAGIGRPEKFFATLREAGADLRGARAFPDHHPFRPAELDGLAAEAARLGAGLVTTEKDAARLPGDFLSPARGPGVQVVRVALHFADAAALAAQVAQVLRRP